MKKIVFVFLVFVLSSFSKKKDEFFDIKDFKKEYAKINEDLYVSKYEVSNMQYRKFLSDLMNSNQSSIYQICLPDTLCWRNPSNYNEPFTQYYFRHGSYDNYPVVGISHEAANQYCTWLTQKYNQDPKRKFQKVSFKLLTKEEWIFAARDSDTSKVYTWGTGFIQNNRKQFLCNFKHTSFIYDSTTKKLNEVPNSDNHSFITVPVKSYYPNSFGLYNMCGNVAEMTSENGIAKGGSYLEPAYNVRIASEKNYAKPQADIGFRVAMKIIEK
jgi:formylglycine-generating enzyme required for sulfatase activity